MKRFTKIILVCLTIILLNINFRDYSSQSMNLISPYNDLPEAKALVVVSLPAYAYDFAEICSFYLIPFLDVLIFLRGLS